MNRILRLPDVIERTALSRSSIYDFAAKGLFPKPMKIGERAVGWLEADITSWIEQKVGGVQ